MNTEEALLGELRKEFYRELEKLKRQHQSFKKRVSLISNLFIPGMGFVIYGDSCLKGLFTFILFVSYNFLFFNKIVNMTDTGTAILFYLPAVAIAVVSTIMVAGLEE